MTQGMFLPYDIGYVRKNKASMTRGGYEVSVGVAKFRVKFGITSPTA